MTNTKKKKLIKQINEVLGIKLYDWQIDYIFADNLPTGMHLEFPSKGAAKGLTTAQILRLLFRPDYKIYNNVWVWPESALSRKSHVVSMTKRLTLYDVFGEDAISLERQEVFINLALDIKRRLNDANVKTNNIRFCFDYEEVMADVIN